MKKALLTVLMFAQYQGHALAFGDVSYGYAELQKKETLKRPRKEFRQEPAVKVDRSIVSYEKDETVLVSKPVVKVEPVVIEKHVIKYLEAPKPIFKTELEWGE